jgi:hypothetical protein
MIASAEGRKPKVRIAGPQVRVTGQQAAAHPGEQRSCQRQAAWNFITDNKQLKSNLRRFLYV